MSYAHLRRIKRINRLDLLDEAALLGHTVKRLLDAGNADAETVREIATKAASTVRRARGVKTRRLV